MKILVFGPKEPMGGVEAIVLDYAKQLIQLGCECDFLQYEKYPELEQKIRALGGNILYATGRRENYIQYKKDLKHIFNTNKYDAVWCNYSGLTNIDILKLAKKAGVPIRITHSHASGFSWGSPLMKILVPIMHYRNKFVIDKYATEIWACSKKSGRFMYPKRLQNRVRVWNNAISLERFKPDSQKRNELRKQYGFEDSLVVGHIGRICREKNQHFLLEVFAHFSKNEPNAKMLFLSDSANGEIIEFSKTLGVYEKIIFLTGKQELCALYNAMDVFFLPSIIEGLPLTLLEAQSCGVPCVTSTGVSYEADVTGYMEFLSLEDDFSKWCSALKSASQKRIKNPYELVAEHNYDIVAEGKKMFEFFVVNTSK